MQYTITPNNLHVKSSFEIRKKDFERELTAIRAEHPESLVWNRSIRSLVREWATHNAFYALGFFRSRTALLGVATNFCHMLRYVLQSCT